MEKKRVQIHVVIAQDDVNGHDLVLVDHVALDRLFQRVRIQRGIHLVEEGQRRGQGPHTHHLARVEHICSLILATLGGTIRHLTVPPKHTTASTLRCLNCSMILQGCEYLARSWRCLPVPCRVDAVEAFVLKVNVAKEAYRRVGATRCFRSPGLLFCRSLNSPAKLIDCSAPYFLKLPPAYNSNDNLEENIEEASNQIISIS